MYVLFHDAAEWLGELRIAATGGNLLSGVVRLTGRRMTDESFMQISVLGAFEMAGGHCILSRAFPSCIAADDDTANKRLKEVRDLLANLTEEVKKLDLDVRSGAVYPESHDY